MKKLMTILAAAVLFLVPQSINAQGRRPEAPLPKWEGLADTPQMGWSSWNKFQTEINEKLIKETADQMVELGLVDALAVEVVCQSLHS